jgi:oligosaccharide repeat unit polymerase
MSAAAPTLPALDYGRLRIPMAAFEVLAYLTIVSAASLAFLAGWLTVNGAVVLTVLLLASLIVLSWINLGQGRHPVFLFLCSLTLFQGGRLIGYCIGAESDPMQVVIMTLAPFAISRDVQGLVLLAISLSAICIYAPCRWLYRPVPPPDLNSVQKYLPYLYCLFAAALPFQLFRNYRYYQYAMEHGGYSFFYTDRAALASSVPFLLRVIPLVTLPVFVAIFVFERRRSRLFLATALYFLTASLILLLGSRAGPLLLVGTLWWISRVKSQGKLRVLRLALLVLALLVVADAVQEHRKGEDESGPYRFSPLKLIVSQGISLNVTEVAFQFRELFSPYGPSYLLTELRSGFLASDVSNYRRGKSLAIDVSVFLQPERYSEGYGTGGSYVADAYVLGGFFALLVVSITLGVVLHGFYRFSGDARLLFFFAIAFPDMLFMPKGQLLDWVSVFLKNFILIALIGVGWKIYSLLASIHQVHPATVVPR